MPIELHTTMTDVDMYTLLVNGQDMCADWITCLLKEYITDEVSVVVLTIFTLQTCLLPKQTATDTICTRLQRLCPSLFTNYDVKITKVCFVRV
jgi:hypothetical protein